MDITHMGMVTRVRYEVYLFHLVGENEDFKDYLDADNYKGAVKTAKEYSFKDGITHTKVVKQIEFFYPGHPDDVSDCQVSKRWHYKKGKLTLTTDF